MDNFKSKIHWWPDEVLRTHCGEIMNGRELDKQCPLVEINE